MSPGSVLSSPRRPAVFGPDGAIAQPVLPRTGRWRFAAHGHTLRIDVAWPEAPPPPGGHPFLLTLDGNAFFFSLTETARAQAQRPGIAIAVEPVVIAVGYECEGAYDMVQRTRDYPPPGLSAFRLLLACELLPWLAGLLPIDRAAGTLIGHSFGGLFTLHTLFAMPDLFRAFVAVSPSLWQDPAAAAAAEAAAPARLAALARPARLLIAVGGQERATSGGRDPAHAARLAERRMVETAEALAQRLVTLDPGHLAVRFDILPDEWHGSIMAAVLPRAVRFAGLEENA